MSQTANAIPKWQVHVDDEYHTSFVLPGGGYTTWVAASFADEFALDAIHVQRGPDMTTPNVADDVEVDRAEFDAWIADILAPPVDPGLDALCSAVDVELIGGSTCPFAPATESTCSAAGGTWEPPACSFGLAPEDCALIGLASDDGLCVPTDEPVVVGTCTALGGEPVGLGCEVAVDAGRCTAATGRVVPSGGCTLTSPPTEATCSALGTGFAWDDVCRFSLDEPLLEPLDESAPDVGGDLAVADEEPTGGDDLTVDDEVADEEPAPVAAATETVVDAPGDGTSGSLLAVLLLALVGAIVVAFLGWLLWWRPRRSGSSGAPVETQVEPMMASVTDGVAASAAGSGVETQVEPIMAGVPDRVVGRSADVESGDDDDDDDGEASEVDALLGMPEIAAAAATQDALEDAGEPTEDWAYADDPLAGEPADPPPVRATIWVVDERNTATRHVLRQQPFSVVAVAPDDGTAPDMVEALLQIGDQSAPITLARVGSDDPGIATYRYNSAPLDDDWELGGHEVTNGMRVTISAESFVPFAGRAHSEVASRDLSLALQHLEAAGDAWRGVLAALPAIESQADGRIDTERLRAVAAAYVRMVELALPVIERHSHHVWGSVLEDDRIELGKAVAAAEAAVYRIPLDPLEAFGSGATPLVLIAGDGRFVDELELAVETQHARTRDAFVGVVGGSLITGYRTFAAMSGGDIWWAIATGTDEMGAARSRWDVAEDLLVEVLIGSPDRPGDARHHGRTGPAAEHHVDSSQGAAAHTDVPARADPIGGRPRRERSSTLRPTASATTCSTTSVGSRRSSVSCSACGPATSTRCRGRRSATP